MYVCVEVCIQRRKKGARGIFHATHSTGFKEAWHHCSQVVCVGMNSVSRPCILKMTILSLSMGVVAVLGVVMMGVMEEEG